MTRSSEPFSVDDVVAARTLAVALDKLVLNHPQIARQRRVTKEAAEKAGWIFDDNAGLIRPVYGHEEAMLPLKRFAPKDYEPWSDDDAKRLYESESELARLISKRHGSEPPDICAFYHELHQYAQALFNMLTSGEVEVYCHNAHSYGYEPISSAAWIREELYVLPRTGDVFEALPMKMKLRWKANTTSGIYERLEEHSVHLVGRRQPRSRLRRGSVGCAMDCFAPASLASLSARRRAMFSRMAMARSATS